MPPKSKWWCYFIKKDSSSAKCKQCGKVLKTAGNTSNLKCHIESMHSSLIVHNKKKSSPQHREREDEPELLPLTNQPNAPSTSTSAHGEVTPLSQDSLPKSSDSVPKRQLLQYSLEKSFKTISTFQEGGSKNSQITQALLYMICKDNLPFSTVEKPGFLKLMKTTAPLYKPPTRKTMKKMIEEKYDLTSEKFKEKLSAPESFTLTTDIWTDTMQTRSFLGTTIHFTEGDKLVSCTLGLIELDKNHTAEYIATELLHLLDQWGLQKEKLHCVVTDGGSNMTKAIEIAFSKKKHLTCFAHVLNLIGQRSLEEPEIRELIEKVKKIVTWFKHSVVASDDLRRSGSDLKLIQNVATRWNSTFYMIKRFLDLSSIINGIVHRHTSAPPMITARESGILKEIKELLSPLETATRDISGDRYMTISIAIPVANNIHKKIMDFTPTSSAADLLKTALLSEINKRFGSIEQIFTLSIATILDPRFKTLYFKNPEDVAKSTNEIKKMLQIALSSAVSSDSSDEISSKETTSSSLFDLHSQLVQQSQKKKRRVNSDMPDQLAIYLRAPADCDITLDPLKYWGKMQHASPELCKIAYQFFGSVATSVPAERLFSKAGQILTQERNRLKGKILSKLLFLQSLNEEYFF